MIPVVKQDLNPVEYYKGFNDMNKPPQNNVRQGTAITDSFFKLTKFLRDGMDISGGDFSITKVLRDPFFNRVSINYTLDTNLYTDHAAQLDDARELRQLSEVRPLILEICHDSIGSSLYMTPATAQMTMRAFYIIYDGYIYRADKVNNINLLYAIYSELYFLKFNGLETEEGEQRVMIDRTRLALFFKPQTFNVLLDKYGIRNERVR